MHHTRLVVLALTTTVVAGCGKPPPDPKSQVVEVREVDYRPDVARYLPLEDGTVYSYDTVTTEETESRGVLIVQISRAREGRIDLRMGGKTERLEIQPDGVAYVEGGYLLKAPIALGSTWKSRTGAVRVEATEQAVKVPAGDFVDCIRTLEEERTVGVSRAVRTTFCPHVGLVQLEVEATSDRGPAHVIATLRSFGPRVDVASGESTTTTTTTDP